MSPHFTVRFYRNTPMNALFTAGASLSSAETLWHRYGTLCGAIATAAISVTGIGAVYLAGEHLYQKLLAPGSGKLVQKYVEAEAALIKENNEPFGMHNFIVTHTRAHRNSALNQLVFRISSIATRKPLSKEQTTQLLKETQWCISQHSRWFMQVNASPLNVRLPAMCATEFQNAFRDSAL